MLDAIHFDIILHSFTINYAKKKVFECRRFLWNKIWSYSKLSTLKPGNHLGSILTKLPGRLILIFYHPSILILLYFAYFRNMSIKVRIIWNLLDLMDTKYQNVRVSVKLRHSFWFIQCFWIIKTVFVWVIVNHPVCSVVLHL